MSHLTPSATLNMTIHHPVHSAVAVNIVDVVTTAIITKQFH